MNYPLELKVLMYHYIRDRGDEAEAGTGIPGLPVMDFKAQLDDLMKRHTFVTWPEVRRAVQDQKPLPDSACLLTFDDGILDHYINVFRILRDRNISGLFFVLVRGDNEDLVLAHKIHFLLARLGLTRLRDEIWDKLAATLREQYSQAENKYLSKFPPISLDNQINLLKSILQRDLSTEVDSVLGDLFAEYIGSERETAQNYYLNPEQIQEMAAGGMHFGGHSQNHPWFDWIDSEARSFEIKASAERLQKIEPGPWAFAYPYGGVSEDSPALLKQHGFVAAFTTHTQLCHPNPYFIGRLDGEEISQDGQGHA
jgi:peptidoglycan/xylan/chitin deacetylase (PgdA/CDA1 family)